MTRTLAPLALLLAAGCADTEPAEETAPYVDPNEGLTTGLVLIFTADNGDTYTFGWSAPDDDAEPEVDDIFLPDGSDHSHHDEASYTLDVEIWNDLEEPPVPLHDDVSEQGTTYQVFFTGNAVEGPASDANRAFLAHDYADVDADGMPLGLQNTMTTTDWGSGKLIVTVQHLSGESEETEKTADLADQVAESGLEALGGVTDIMATFRIEVE